MWNFRKIVQYLKSTKSMISFIKIIINRIKNIFLVEFQRELHSYNPIENVFQWMADYYLVLSPNFDDVINNSKITLKRKLIYYTNFAIHLSVLIKYTFLAKYSDLYTIALLGESLHYLFNIYIISYIFVLAELTFVPLMMYMRYMGDRRVANSLVTISKFDTNRAFNRINNRKVTNKVWLMNKMFAIIIILINWVIIPLALLYCAISVHLDQTTRHNLATLAINSVILLATLIILTGRFILYMVQFR